MRGLRPARRLLRLAVLPALVLALPGSAAAADLQVRNVDTSRLPTVRLTVTAPDGARRPAFEVRENGAPVRDVVVQRPTGRMAVSLVIDASHTMRGRPLTEAVAAAREFVGRKRPDDEIAVFAFGSEVATAQPLTSDGVRLGQALDGIAIGARQGTRLHDAVAAGLRELVATPPTTRRVLIVLADGEDNASSTTADALRAAAVRDQVTVYAIAIKSSVYDRAALDTIASRTGGSSFEAATADLRQAYRSIGEDLARTYVLSYPSTAPDRVVVEVSSGGAHASAAYLAPPVRRPTTGGGIVPEAVTHAGWSAPVLAGLTLVLVLAGLLTTVLRPRPRRSLPELLAPYAATSPAQRAERGPDAPSVSFLRHVAQSTERVLGDLQFWKSIARTLERSDLPLRTPELFYLMIGVGLLLGLVATVLGLPTLVALVAMLLGGLVPLLVVARKAKKRQRAFDDQLPDTLMTMASSMRAGHSFNQAMDTVVSEGGQPMAGEFARVAAEIRLGQAPDAALERMAQRMDSRNFAFVVTSVNIQRQVGGSLAEILDSVAETVRGRQQFLRKIKALTAMGRASAYVLVAMPFAMAGLISLLNRQFLAPLFTTTAGHFMIAGALTSLAIGSLILKKIVTFKV